MLIGLTGIHEMSDLIGQRDILESIIQFSRQKEEEGILAAGDEGIQIVFDE